LVKIEILKISESLDGFTAQYFVDGGDEKYNHTFPKGEDWEDEDGKGIPKFIKKLITIHEMAPRNINTKYIGKKYNHKGEIK